MEIATNDARQVAVVTPGSVPSRTQWLSNRGRTRSQPLKRVITYDCDEKTLQVRKVKSFESQYLSADMVPS